MEIYSPLRAIKIKCLDCCGWQRKEVDLCPSKDCPLWAYRKGHRPSQETVREVEQTTDRFAEQKKKFGFGREGNAQNAQNLAIYRAKSKGIEDEGV